MHVPFRCTFILSFEGTGLGLGTFAYLLRQMYVQRVYMHRKIHDKSVCRLKDLDKT